MSDANLERLRGLLEPWSGKDLRSWASAWRSGEADLSLLDPSVVYEDTILPDQVGEAYRGHEGVARAMERWTQPYGELTTELERIVGTGDLLVSIHRVKSRGDYTGIQFDFPLAYVWCFRDGRVVLFRSYWDPKEALAAAGLAGWVTAEESTTPDLVELMRGNMEAGSRGDLDTAMTFYAPDAVWDTSPMGLGVYEGQPAIRLFFEDWLTAYDEFEIEPEEICDLGHGVVFVAISQNARLVGSPGRVQVRYAAVAIWAGRVIVRLTHYSDIDEARAAAERLANERE